MQANVEIASTCCSFETTAKLHMVPVISFFVEFQECAVDPKATPALRHPRLHEPQTHYRPGQRSMSQLVSAFIIGL